MNHINAKAIIMDLDGTLLHSNKTISTYTQNILKKCKQQGIYLMVATARPLRNTLPYTQIVDFDAMVVSNGARIVCKEWKTERNIAKETALKFVNALTQHQNLRITLETGDSAYSNFPIMEYETIVTKDLAGIIKQEVILKILVHLDHKDTLDIVKNKMPGNLHYSISQGYLMQIMDNTATKWNGVQTLLEHFKCKHCDSVYFGDDNDDIGPIKSCGIGVAVANGIDVVKAAADAVTESNDCDGVAKFIEAQILK
jgi:Cof subfamily protein (haloacid dehalogenase superfamily)